MRGDRFIDVSIDRFTQIRIDSISLLLQIDLYRCIIATLL